MKKIIRLTESDLTKLVKKIIIENDEEFDDEIGKPKFNVEPHVKMQPREKEIESQKDKQTGRKAGRQGG